MENRASGTIIDVAKRAGVAPSTVSNVLSRKKYVSPEVAEKVRLACKEVNYKANFIASTLVTKKTNIIGLFLTPDEDKYDSFFSSLIQGIGLSLSRAGYSLMLYFNVTNSQDIGDVLLSKRGMIDGAILLSPISDDFRIRELEAEGIPYVIIGHPSEPNGGQLCVDVDNRKNTADVTLHLLRHRHRNILFLNSGEKYTITQDRFYGFLDAYRSAILEPNLQLIHNVLMEDDLNQTVFSRIGDINFTACIAESDVTAKKVYDFVQSRNRTVGKDFAVAALGGESVAESVNPPMTTISVDYDMLGRSASRMLLAKLEGGEPPEPAPAASKILYRASSDFFLPV